MTREQYNKIVFDIMETKDFAQLVENSKKTGMVISSMYAFAMAIGDEVCDD